MVSNRHKNKIHFVKCQYLLTFFRMYVTDPLLHLSSETHLGGLQGCNFVAETSGGKL